MTDPLLHHDLLTAAADARPERWLYVLHGILGAGRNWRSVMVRLLRARPEWGAVLVDLREHGRSQGFPPPHTLAAAAGDVRALVQATGLPASAVLGHSFGGKVALLFAREYALEVGLRQLWIVDSIPARVSSPQGSAWEMIQLLRRLPGPFANRGEALAALTAAGVSGGVAQWVSTNLVPIPTESAAAGAGGDTGAGTEARAPGAPVRNRSQQGARAGAGASRGGLRWRLDLDAMEALLLDFFRADLWSVVENPPDEVRLHFLKAERSTVMPEKVVERIEAIGRSNGRVDLHRIPGGHWLNADNPQAVEELLIDEL